MAGADSFDQAPYTKASKKRGRPPYPLGTMLLIHLLQQWYSLSAPAFTERSGVGRRPLEEALIEVPTMRRFAGIELISDRILDETTILTFRHLLEKHGLGKQIFETVKARSPIQNVLVIASTAKNNSSQSFPKCKILGT